MSTGATKLKVKLKSLAAESKIIRKEELKRKGKNWHTEAYDLSDHRRFELRPTIRNVHIAYGLVRGLNYKQIEQKCYSEPNWKSIRLMVNKYSDYENRVKLLQDIDALEKGEMEQAA